MSRSRVDYPLFGQPHRAISETTGGPAPAAALASDFVLQARPVISRKVVRGLARICEGTFLFVSGWAIATTYVPDIAHSLYLLSLAATAAFAVVVFGTLGLYRVSALASVSSVLSRLVLGWLVSIAALLASAFFLKIGLEFSRVWLALWFAVGAVGMVGARAGFAVLVKSWMREGRLNKRAVIYGVDASTEDLLQALAKQDTSDLLVCGVFDDREKRSPAAVAGVPKLGTLDDLVEFARRYRIDTVILNLPVAAEQRLLEALRVISVLPVDIRLPARATRIRFMPRTYSYVGDLAFIDLFDRPIDGWGVIAKWLFDKVIALAAIIALAPVMAAVAVAIRLESRGPILFRQKRYGFNNELIEVFKFRSMYTEMTDASATRLVTRDDPRVTRVGRFIRRTSLDELPQLFNVLAGDLSLVGPRPHAPQAKAADRLYTEVVDGYFARHKVKPGITGWAQINGWRGETDTSEKIRKRVEHDLYYIENWSLFLDLYILVKTPFALIDTRNAY